MRKSLMRLTLRQLQIFNEVCDLRSYSRAADEMSLTQPAVSLQTVSYTHLTLPTKA